MNQETAIEESIAADGAIDQATAAASRLEQSTTDPALKVGIIFVEVDGGEVAVPRTVRVTERIAKLVEKLLDRLAEDCPEEVQG